MRRGRERGDRQSKAEDPAATVSRDLIRGANNLARPCALPERNGCLSVYRAPRSNQNQKGGAHGPWNTALAARRANSHHHTHRSSLSLIAVAPAGFALDSPESPRPRQRRSSMAGSLGRCPLLNRLEGTMAKTEQDRKSKKKEDRKSKNEEDRQLSKELEMSFPASDPPSATQPGSGITGPWVRFLDEGRQSEG